MEGIHAPVLVLHANWTDHHLHIWAEDASRFEVMSLSRSDRTESRRGADESALHPFAAGHDGVRRIIKTIAPATGDPHASDLHLQIPAGEGGLQPSAQLAGLIDRPRLVRGTRLQPVLVPSLALEPAAAFDFLIALRYGADESTIELSAELLFLARAAALVADSLADQRYLPSIIERSTGELHGVWTPWLEDADVRERVQRLALSMPPAARAALDDLRGDPWLLLEQMLSDLTDAVVRRITLTDGFGEAVSAHGNGDPHVAFLSGLLSEHSTVARPHETAADGLYSGVRKWIAVLRPPEDAAAHCLVIRLHEPPAPVSKGARVEAAWMLAFHIQSSDGDALVGVEELWKPAPTRPRLAARVETLQEFALREIRRAADLFEPIGRALDAARPDAITLSTSEAYLFLRDAAPLLDDAGVRIILPEWWGTAHGRLSARLVLDSSKSTLTARRDGIENPTAARLGLRSLVHYRWEVMLGEEPLSADDLERLVSRREPFVHIDGRWVEIRPQDVGAARALIIDSAEGAMSAAEALAAANGLGPRAPGLPIAGVSASGWISDLLDAERAGQLRLVDQPERFRGTLRPYQRLGLSWLAFLEQYGLGGCLADDMGLGKTIQLIALLQREREVVPHSALGPTLVVAPLSVLANWARECGRFAPELRVIQHHGSDRRLGEAFARASAAADVVITTYGLVGRDIETLQRINWHRVVLDEAQNVKNAPTRQAQAVRALAASHRLALTGTPVENRLSELWSVMDFCNPGYLGTANDFRSRFEIPIERHHDHERATALRGLIRPFVLRRLKTDRSVVPDLPELFSTREYATLTTEQAALYQTVVDTMLRDVDAATGMKRRGLVLAAITRLKQICNHPANLPPGALGHTHMAEPHPDGRADGPGGLAQRSGKVRRLIELLEEVVATDAQALIFTQFRRMGDLLVRIITHELSIPVLFMHGGVSAQRRQEMIDRFQDESMRTPVFVLSLKTGGLGLNLTGASHVFHFDRWWNPAVENQATDRAFRIGQTRNVHVHRLICSGTLEEHIDQMIEDKTDLAERIVGAGDAWLTEFSTSRLRELLTLREASMEDEL